MEDKKEEGEAEIQEHGPEHWFSKWERQCLAEAEQEEALAPELQDEAAAQPEHKQQKLWHLFQNSATAVAQLYKGEHRQGPGEGTAGAAAVRGRWGPGAVDSGPGQWEVAAPSSRGAAGVGRWPQRYKGAEATAGATAGPQPLSETDGKTKWREGGGAAVAARTAPGAASGAAPAPARPGRTPSPGCRSARAGALPRGVGAPAGAATGGSGRRGRAPSAGEGVGGGGTGKPGPAGGSRRPAPGRDSDKMAKRGRAHCAAGAAGRSPPLRGHRARCPGRAAAPPPRSAPIRGCLRKVEQNGET